MCESQPWFVYIFINSDKLIVWFGVATISVEPIIRINYVRLRLIVSLRLITSLRSVCIHLLKFRLTSSLTFASRFIGVTSSLRFGSPKKPTYSVIMVRARPWRTCPKHANSPSVLSHRNRANMAQIASNEFDPYIGSDRRPREGTLTLSYISGKLGNTQTVW